MQKIQFLNFQNTFAYKVQTNLIILHQILVLYSLTDPDIFPHEIFHYDAFHYMHQNDHVELIAYKIAWFASLCYLDLKEKLSEMNFRHTSPAMYNSNRLHTYNYEALWQVKIHVPHAISLNANCKQPTFKIGFLLSQTFKSFW